MYPTLGPMIQKRRHQVGLTQDQVARAVRMHRISYARLEGGGALPSLGTLVRIARALRTPVWRLLKAADL